jgi:hypothetical protein
LRKTPIFSAENCDHNIDPRSRLLVQRVRLLPLPPAGPVTFGGTVALECSDPAEPGIDFIKVNFRPNYPKSIVDQQLRTHLRNKKQQIRTYRSVVILDFKVFQIHICKDTIKRFDKVLSVNFGRNGFVKSIPGVPATGPVQVQPAAHGHPGDRSRFLSPSCHLNIHHRDGTRQPDMASILCQEADHLPEVGSGCSGTPFRNIRILSPCFVRHLPGKLHTIPLDFDSQCF